MRNTLNGAKVVNCRKVFLAYRDTWNYGGFGKRKGMEYRECDPAWCWEKGLLTTNRALIFGVERFMWFYEKHPTKDEMWWCVHSVDAQGNII
jgi:hypothetical protein